MNDKDNYIDLIELGIEATNLFSDGTPEIVDTPVSKYGEFDLHEKDCKCESCLDALSSKVTLKYSSTGLGDLGGILMNQLGNKEYDVDLKLVDRVDTYDSDGNEITDHIIQLQGRDAKKMTKNLTEKGWKKFSALEFGVLQVYKDEKCKIPDQLVDASRILATSPSVKITIGPDEFYVKLKDIIDHETRKLIE